MRPILDIIDFMALFTLKQNNACDILSVRKRLV